MAISDDRRHALHNRLDEVLGPDEAATLMEHLPPPWADLATTRDLGAVEARIAAAEENLRLRLEALEDRIRAEFGDRLTQHTRTLWVAMVGQSGVMAAGIFGAAALFA